MLAKFYIPRLSNDMKLAVQKNHLGAQILYSTPDHIGNFQNKKRRQITVR